MSFQHGRIYSADLAVGDVVIPTMARYLPPRNPPNSACSWLTIAHTHENCLFSREQVYYLQ